MVNGHGTKEPAVPMNNSFFVIGIIALVAIGAILFLSGPGDAAATGNAVASNGGSGNVQVVQLYVQNGQYIMTPSEFKIGVPVRIEGDISRMPGCSKSIVISAFNIRKTLSSSDNAIEFTPDKAGTFNIACSMNMYRGTFTVLQNNGSKSSYTDTASPTGGPSCGASGGGCGCGG